MKESLGYCCVGVNREDGLFRYTQLGSNDVPRFFAKLFNIEHLGDHFRDCRKPYIQQKNEYGFFQPHRLEKTVDERGCSVDDRHVRYENNQCIAGEKRDQRQAGKAPCYREKEYCVHAIHEGDKN